MPITFSEKWESRPSQEGDSPQVELLYIADGSDDDLAIKSAALAFLAPTYDGLISQSFSIKRIAEDEWLVSAIYGRRKSEPATGESTFEFQIGTENVHITQTIETVGQHGPPGQDAPNKHGIIGLTDDGVQGVDVFGPVYNFSERHYVPAASVTAGYKAGLFALAAHTNIAPFKGFAIGEVIFLGASGSARGGDDWEISYAFAARPNLTGITVGDIVGIAKKGHEYLWSLYQDVVETVSTPTGDKKFLVKKPIAVYVERVFYKGAFSALGIGS